MRRCELEYEVSSDKLVLLMFSIDLLHQGGATQCVSGTVCTKLNDCELPLSICSILLLIRVKRLLPMPPRS